MNKFGNEEPSADMRASARNMRQYFVALVHEGFTEAQALQIVGVMLSAAIAAMPPPEDK